MEAKDTVMNDESEYPYWGSPYWGKESQLKWNVHNLKEYLFNQWKQIWIDHNIDNLLKAQAEISFKAGTEIGYQRGLAMKPNPDGVYENGLRDGRREGIQEVVKWIKENCPHKTVELCDARFEHITKAECTKCWQAFLKEKGL